MPFLTNSDQDVQEMLHQIGVPDFETLVANIPKDLRFKGKLDIPDAISELEITSLMDQLGSKNVTSTSFLGGGAYDHYIPAIIDTLIGRSEFYTAYTPYQPEVSQGTLQSIYEFQSMICELSGMDVTNASMYEGGSALAEAMLLACGHTRRKKILISGAVNCRYKQVLETYILHNDIELIEIPIENFTTNIDQLKNQLSEEIAAVIIQHPNYFGYLEDVFGLKEMIETTGALFISYYDPISLGVMAPPGHYGADLAIAEGQVLGNRQNFGGPFVGLFSSKEKYIRKIPGRLSGKTTDLDGKEGFVLTLQTREQHIRRDKATSNICTNSGLMALAATIYLAVMGRQGIRDTANLCLQKSHYLAEALNNLPGVNVMQEKSFFKEFVAEFPLTASEVLSILEKDGIFGGISLEESGYPNHLLVAVTEKRTKQEMDKYVSVVKGMLG
jgi:glycine dehydrogenase subunit 1